MARWVVRSYLLSFEAERKDQGLVFGAGKCIHCIGLVSATSLAVFSKMPVVPLVGDRVSSFNGASAVGTNAGSTCNGPQCDVLACMGMSGVGPVGGETQSFSRGARKRPAHTGLGQPDLFSVRDRHTYNLAVCLVAGLCCGKTGGSIPSSASAECPVRAFRCSAGVASVIYGGDPSVKP